MPDSPNGPGKKILEQVHKAQEKHLFPETPDSPQRQYLSFRLNEQWYALSVYQLVEILRLPRITRVPSVPEHIVGVMNLRGEVLSVVDLKLFFGLLQDVAPEDPAIVVVDHGGVRTGFLVDAVGDLVSLGPADLTEEPLLAGKAESRFFGGAARLGDSLVSIVNLEGLLESEGMYSPP